MTEVLHIEAVQCVQVELFGTGGSHSMAALQKWQSLPMTFGVV